MSDCKEGVNKSNPNPIIISHAAINTLNYLQCFRIKSQDRWQGFKFQQVQDFSLLHNIHSSSGAHPASYAMGARSDFPQSKTVGHEADHSPHLVQRSRMVELYLQSFMFSWHGA
jgi:hypothetical protein